MTVNVTKPQINVREKLSELDKPSGIAGEAILRSETPQEVFNYINAGRRNLIINGAMQVAQRGTSATDVGLTVAYNTVDRWRFADASNPVTRFTQTQSTDAPSGFSNSHKFEVTTVNASVNAADTQYTDYFIEAQDLQHLAYGTSDAKKITLSFWVKSSVAQTFGVGLTHEDGGGSYGVSYTVDSADTWEYKTLTFNGNTSTAFANDNGRGIRVRFALTAGSNYVNGSDATTWSGQAFGQHSNTWVATSGATWQITGVQLEVGKVATPFEHRSYGEELALCQRYAYVTEGSVGSGGVAITTTQPHIHIQYPVIMRSAPSASLNTSGSFKISDDYSADKTASSLSVGVTNSTNFKSRIRVDGFSGLTVGRFYAPDGNSSTTAKILFDAEL